jgi:DNA-binding PadR family transcriptional regulator
MAARFDRRPHGRGRRGHEHREPFGFGPLPFGSAGFGGFTDFRRFAFGRAAPKARRGDVRTAVLILLAEAPRNGYQLMQEIESRSGGLWRPSPGSMYPVLQQLEDEGLVRPEGQDGRRVFQLTDEGRSYVEAHAADLGAPWDSVADSFGENAADYHGLMIQVLVAARQVAHVGTTAQLDEAQTVLADTRRRLYRILAEDAPDADGDAPVDGAR